jgi:hypothetical protein
VPLFSL